MALPDSFPKARQAPPVAALPLQQALLLARALHRLHLQAGQQAALLEDQVFATELCPNVGYKKAEDTTPKSLSTHGYATITRKLTDLYISQAALAKARLNAICFGLR